MNWRGVVSQRRSTICVVTFAALLAIMFGCRPKPRVPPPRIDDLRFPVAVLFTHSSAVLFEKPADLNTMHVNYLKLPDNSPTLIDSSFAVYTLEKLRSTHGGLWLMAHPSGMTEVTFELTRAPKSGLAAARELMQHHLDSETWRRNLDQKRKALAAQTTVPGMLEVLHDTSD